MKAFLVQKEISFDYRKFPWITKSRGKVVQKWDMQIVAATNEEEAKRKFLNNHKETTLTGLWTFVVNGFLKFMCKHPNYKIDIHIKEISDKNTLKSYMEYITMEDFKLLTQSE